MAVTAWRFLDSGSLEGAEQMALDAGLMARARATGEAVLRVYSWSRPTLSFGRHEAVRGRFDAGALERANVGAVRRPTGGRVLLHWHEVTYSVTGPAAERETLGSSYGRINGLLLDALDRLGVRASLAPPGRSARPGGMTCFTEPNAGEIVVDGRKLAGSAQLREGGALLQHGSILVADDQARISALSVGHVTPAAPAASLERVLGRSPHYAEVRDALLDALRAREGHVEFLEASEAAGYAAPERARFLDAEWTWRR